MASIAAPFFLAMALLRVHFNRMADLRAAQRIGRNVWFVIICVLTVSFRFVTKAPRYAEILTYARAWPCVRDGLVVILAQMHRGTEILTY